TSTATCTRSLRGCRSSDWLIASHIASAASSSDMVMVRLHRLAFTKKIPRRHSAVLGTLTRQMMTGLNNNRIRPDHDLRSQDQRSNCRPTHSPKWVTRIKMGTADATSSEGQVAKRENY